MLHQIKGLSQGAKASIALFISSIVTKGISYLTTPIYTRLLSSEEFGQVSIFLTWQNVFGIIAMFSLTNGVFNNGMVDYPQKRYEYSNSMLGLSNLITLVTLIILIAVYPMITNYIQLEPEYILLMFILFIFQPAFNFWSSKERYELKWKKLTLYSILFAIASPLCAIACIYMFANNRLPARIFGAEIPLIIGYIAFYFFIAKKANFKIDTRFWKEAFFFNLPLLPHYLSALLLGCSDSLMISHYIGFSATAYYSIAYSISTIVMVLWNAVNASLIPYTYEHCKNGDFASVAKVTYPILYLFAAITFFATLLAPEIISILATREYTDAIYCIPPIMVGVFFQVLYYIFANVVFFFKRPKYVMVASVTATALNIILNSIFIPRYGYLAAGYTSLLCYFIQAMIDYFALRLVLKKNLYSTKILVSVSIVVIILGGISIILYDNCLIRYITILLLCVILFVKRNQLQTIIKIR